MDGTATPVDFHDIANRRSQECMAAIGCETVKGAAGWQFGRSPQEFIREAIVNALRDVGMWDDVMVRDL